MKLERAKRRISTIEAELWDAIHEAYAVTFLEDGTDLTYRERNYMIYAAYALRNARVALEQIE